eukprot:4998012-Ditylum_brightwellii.AAC.1
MTITVDMFALVKPKKHKFLHRWELVRMRYQETLEYIVDVANIEFIVKIGSSFSEYTQYECMESHRSFDQ